MFKSERVMSDIYSTYEQEISTAFNYDVDSLLNCNYSLLGSTKEKLKQFEVKVPKKVDTKGEKKQIQIPPKKEAKEVKTKKVIVSVKQKDNESVKQHSQLKFEPMKLLPTKVREVTKKYQQPYVLLEMNCFVDNVKVNDSVIDFDIIDCDNTECKIHSKYWNEERPMRLQNKRKYRVIGKLSHQGANIFLICIFAELCSN